MAINLGAKKAELIKKSTKSLSKTLSPGSGVFTVTGMSWRANSYNDNDGIDIIMHLEGEDLTDQGFEGFWIDKDDTSLGRHKGAVGQVKLSRYSFATKDFPSSATREAQTVTREEAVVNEMSKLSVILGKEHELIAGIIENDTDMITNANNIFKGAKIRATIGGREYKDNGGYTKHSLHIVKADKGCYAYENPDTLISKIQPFDAGKHIEKLKAGAGADVIETFEPVSVDFDDVFTV